MASEEPSTSKKGKTKYNTNCCVYQCHSRKGADRSIHFHAFPEKNCGIKVRITNSLGQEEEIDKRKAWEKVLLMGKPVTKYMRVCSKHFTSEDYCAKGANMKQPKLKRFAVPSQKLPKKKLEISSGSKGELSGLRKQRLAKRQQLRERSSCTMPIGETPLCDVSLGEAENQAEDIPIRSFEELDEEEKVAVQNLLVLGNMQPCFMDKAIQVSSGDFIVTFSSTIKQETHLNSLTGIKSFELLDLFTDTISKNYPDKRIHKLSIKDRIIIVFMKLKMALKLNVLSFLFKISPSLCKKIFVEYIGYMSNILKDFIYWPSFKEIQENIPICFEHFKTVRIVLDCLEIPIEKPKCLCCRIRTYSHYKGKQTIKIMTGISPTGLLTFVSKSYGGRSSDKAIFEQSNLIRKLCPYQDSVMIDKGFLIDVICTENNIKIVRPHFLRKKKQFSESEAKENVLISKARVHIERVNQRMRIFNILNVPLSNHFVPLIDDIILIICAMVNLQNPVLSNDKFVEINHVESL